MTTDELLAQLRGSKTDLGRLLRSCCGTRHLGRVPGQRVTICALLIDGEFVAQTIVLAQR
jgi:hypothetical protein